MVQPGRTTNGDAVAIGDRGVGRLAALVLADEVGQCRSPQGGRPELGEGRAAVPLVAPGSVDEAFEQGDERWTVLR